MFHLDPVGHHGSVTPIARLSLVALDCRDPLALAEFYRRLTGWSIDPVPPGQEWWVQLRSPNGATLAFQEVADHQPPGWPDGDPPQQMHLDFDVDDLDLTESQVIALGAQKAEHQPKPQYWRVFVDPAGHPFCLVLDEAQRQVIAAEEQT